VAVKKNIFLVLSILFVPISHIVKKGKVVILQTRSRKVYCDNTKYLYESLSEMKNIEVYWLTDNRDVKQYIKDKNWNYITWSNPIKMIIIALRAKVVVDNGGKFFNPFGITGIKSVVKICLGHGSGPKATLHRTHNIETALNQIIDINKFDYVNFTSEYFADNMGKKTYFLPNEKILTLAYPRCDAFFDDVKVKKSHQRRKLSRLLYPSITSEDMVVLYTPTWRPYKYSFPLCEMPGFSFEDFDDWLKLNNFIFFYTVHSNMLPENLPINLNRVVFIDSDSNPLFDVNEFMLEVDLLVNDYSTTSTDFSILNRPQVFYMPDYERYNAEKCFLEPYRDIMPGYEVVKYEEFKELMLSAGLNPESYVGQYQEKIDRLQEKYYDTGSKHATKDLAKFISKLL